MSVIRRIQQLYTPVTDPGYKRYDNKIDNLTILDPEVKNYELKDHEQIEDEFDLSPVESLFEGSDYFTPSYQTVVNKPQHPTIDFDPNYHEESLLKTQDKGSDDYSPLKNDDDGEGQYVPSDVVDYFEENANSDDGSCIEKVALKNGRSYIKLHFDDYSTINPLADTSIIAEDLMNEIIMIAPELIDTERLELTKSGDELKDYMKEIVDRIDEESKHLGHRFNYTDENFIAGMGIFDLLLSMDGPKIDSAVKALIPPLTGDAYKTYVRTLVDKIQAIEKLSLDILLENIALVSLDIAITVDKTGKHVAKDLETGEMSKFSKALKKSMKNGYLGDFASTKKGTRVYDFGSFGNGFGQVRGGKVFIASTVKIENKSIYDSNLLIRGLLYDYVIYTHGHVDSNGSWSCDPICVNDKVYTDVVALIKSIMVTGNERVYLNCCNPGHVEPDYVKDYPNLEFSTTNTLIEAATNIPTDINLRNYLVHIEKSIDQINMVEVWLIKRASVGEKLHNAGEKLKVYEIDIDNGNPKIKLKKIEGKPYKAVIASAVSLYRTVLFRARSILKQLTKTNPISSYGVAVNEAGYYWKANINLNRSWMPEDSRCWINLPNLRFRSFEECAWDAIRYGVTDEAGYQMLSIYMYEDTGRMVSDISGVESPDYLEQTDCRCLIEAVDKREIHEQSYSFMPSTNSDYYQLSVNLSEAAMKAKQRNALDDSEFGLPRLRAYPLNDAKHVKAAIRMFNHCKDPEDQKTLANNIFKAMKKYNVDMKIGEGNALYKYAPESLREAAYPKFGYMIGDKPMKERTKDDIVKEHLRVNSDFFNNVFYGVEYANAIKDLNKLDFLDVFYPNLRTMAFGNRVYTTIGGLMKKGAKTYNPSSNWFHVDLSDDEQHTEYCIRLYAIMADMLKNPNWTPSSLEPDQMGILMDWLPRVSYHYGSYKEYIYGHEDDFNPPKEAQREIQYLWDLFWNYNENPDDHHIRSINIIALVSQMASVKDQATSINEDQLIGKQELSSYLEKELGNTDDIYLLPKTKEFPTIDQLSVHLAMDKFGAIPKNQRNEYAKNLNRRYKELRCTFSISVDHPFAIYADPAVRKHMEHVLMEDSSLPVDDTTNDVQDKINREERPWFRRSDFVPGSNWHNVLDNKEMGPNNAKSQRPDFTVGEALL